MARHPMKHVIVLLPGIGGSELTKDNRPVWAFSAGAVARGLVSLGGSVKALQLTEDPWEVDDLGDGVEAVSTIPDLHLIPGLWKIDGYDKIARAIKAAFDVTAGQNYFEFPYDWRRDNRVAARRLARQSHDWLKAWREGAGGDDAKLILIGHSMGGIVARAFLELLDGWRDTAMLLTFGTPYGGSVNALDFLANGFTKKLGPLTLVDISAMLRSFTSVYQLLPVFRCVESTGSVLSRLDEVDDLPNLDRAKVLSALEFHRDIERHGDEHRATGYEGTGGYDIRPVVGEFQPTRQSARIVDGRVESLMQRLGTDEGGDGTVPVLSSMPKEHLEERSNVMFAAERHASLQNFDPVLVQVRALLRGEPVNAEAYYALNSRVSVDMEDLYVAGEEVAVRAQPEMEGVALLATVMEAATGDVVVRRQFGATDTAWQEAVVGPLAPGDYRVAVSGGAGVDTVTDVMTVVDVAALTTG